MGGEQFSQPYIDQLESFITDHYSSVIRQNEAKNVFSAARTPAVIFACSVFFYVLSGILGTLGLMTLANIANVVMLVFVALLCVWVYARYTGEHREYGQFVDHVAEALWDEVSR
jgi:atlastin